MRYEGALYRPPSEADAYILQATVGCSWNKCTYCDMYRAKSFRVRPIEECVEDIREAARIAGERIRKVFVADGDALVMGLDHWEPILAACRETFPRLRRVSCYAMAPNVTAKSDDELHRLRALGLSRLYLGPETGDPATMKRIAKGSTPEEHVEASARAGAADMERSVIFLLGAGGTERSDEHAAASAALASRMDPEFLAALTLSVLPNTPIAKLESSGRFRLPDARTRLRELRTFVDEARPSDALFRTNHASNDLALGGRLPADRGRIIEAIDAALAGRIPLRPEGSKGL